MGVKDQLKILDRKIKQNRADYDLCRQNAEISALSSGELNKYEYLTGKDLGYKPDSVQKSKFEYSPLGQVFNNGLKKDEKQERLLKRLKNIEDKTDNQLRAIENKSEDPGIKSIFDKFKEQLSPEGEIVLNQIFKMQKLVNYLNLDLTGGNGEYYNFRVFSFIGTFIRKIYTGRVFILSFNTRS